MSERYRNNSRVGRRRISAASDLRVTLRGSGYNVLQARRGDHAIDLAEQYKGSIALMISDIVLPDMNGPSVVAKGASIASRSESLIRFRIS